MDKKNQSKPWLSENGKMKSPDEIKKICKDWKPVIWEEYLQHIEKPQKDLLFDNPLNSENFSQEDHDKHQESIDSVIEYPMLKEKLVQGIKDLSIKQQTVLHEIYFEGKKLREVASKMNISTSSVADLRDRALKRLGSLYIENVVLLPNSSCESEKRGAEKAERITIGREA